MNSHEELAHTLQELYASVASVVRPTLAADLQERIWQHLERLETLRTAQQPEAPPLAARPRGLPALLNPFYFTPRCPLGSAGQAPRK